MPRTCARWSVLAAVGLLGLSFSRASADTVVLRDGRSIAGTVREVRDGTLLLQTDFAGEIKIAWSKVAGLETEHPVRLWLKDGRRLRGTAQLGEPGSFRLRPEGDEAPLDIPVADVEHLNDPGSVWKGRINLSGKKEDGNSDSAALFLTAEVSWETDAFRALLRGNGGHETKNSENTEKNAYVIAKTDFFLSLETYVYLSDEYKMDRFEDLVFRNVASFGPGYHVTKDGGLEIRLEAGPAYIAEELRDGTHDTWCGGRASCHLRLDLPVGLELRNDATVYPNFETWKDWQFHNEAALSTRLGAGWLLTLAVISEWDNEPAPGKVEHDNKYVAGIGFQF